jgi:hypothetical protein
MLFAAWGPVGHGKGQDIKANQGCCVKACGGCQSMVTLSKHAVAGDSKFLRHFDAEPLLSQLLPNLKVVWGLEMTCRTGLWWNIAGSQW